MAKFNNIEGDWIGCSLGRDFAAFRPRDVEEAVRIQRTDSAMAKQLEAALKRANRYENAFRTFLKQARARIQNPCGDPTCLVCKEIEEQIAAAQEALDGL